jgi:hypothetical protein
MRVQFFDDPSGGPRSRDEVRFKNLGLYVYEDRKRIAVGFDITPFFERPSIEVVVKNVDNEESASLSVIDSLQYQFNVTLHLRDESKSQKYSIEAILFYRSIGGDKKVVDKIARTFDTSSPGEK